MSRSLTTRRAPQLATQQDLDRKISEVTATLFADAAPFDAAAPEWAPVPIRAAELVRRMRQFVVYN